MRLFGILNALCERNIGIEKEEKQMRRLKLLPLLFGIFLLCGCAFGSESTATSPGADPTTYQTEAIETLEPTDDPQAAALRERENLLVGAVSNIAPVWSDDTSAESFVLWLEAERDPQILSELAAASASGQSVESLLWDRTGESIHVLHDGYFGLLDNPESAKAADIYFTPDNGNHDKTIVLAFGGDVNLMDGGYVMPTYSALGGSVSAVLTGGLLEEMLAADILLLNNEFAFTDRGAPLPGKGYSFRARPENVSILDDMGVDVAFLANNHVFDYGTDGLFDTLETLDGAGIPRIGAGMNLEEASKPVYYIVNGRKIAFIGAGCIERYSVFTPGATDDSAGIFRCDEINSEPLMSIIRDCAENSDFVVVNLHWGIESTTVLESYQRDLGQMCIDAGADAVIGSHPHVLQGSEFYSGKPIIYSTGNFWFSRTQNRTGLFKLILDESGGLSVKLLPCLTGGGVTSLQSGNAAAQIFNYYESISWGVSIDDEGYITAIE